MAEGQNDPQGPYFYQEGGKTYASLPLGMIQGIQQSPLFENEERLRSRRHQTPKGHYGKRPEDPCINTPRISEECGSQDNASNEQSQCGKRDGREGSHEQSNPFCDDGISGLHMSEPSQNARTTKMQVTSIALQTDSCDTLYVTKNTLVAYTIAVVQNTQMLQYEQMHVALQTAQNQASLETPL